MINGGPLKDKGRVVVIGGGPSGSACALKLNRLAAAQGKSLEITLLEGKRFSDGHYNACVGVLSPPLPELLQDELGVDFPYHLERARVEGYILHATRETLSIPDDHPSIALRRVHFDTYMLEQARESGINVMEARAVDLEFHTSRVVVYTENKPLECDVVVGAFGLDGTSGAAFQRATRYEPPGFMSAMVTKYHPPKDFMEAFGNSIHAFLPRYRHIEFAGITPKGNHLTINIAGKAVNSDMMRDFLMLPQVLQVLGSPRSLKGRDPADGQFYKGSFPCEVARHYYGDRYVMLGDAAGLVRPFKGKGVTAAVASAIRAADTILNVGICKEAFHDHYRNANQDILGDMAWGRAARFLTGVIRRVGMMDVMLRAGASNDAFRQALLGAVSAHESYRTVFAKAFEPRAVMAVMLSLFGLRR